MVPTLSLSPVAKYDRVRQDEIDIKLYGLRDTLILSSTPLAPDDFESNSSFRLKIRASAVPLMILLFLLSSR
jgi:hypothetical protein